jgi:hypothetical protein
MGKHGKNKLNPTLPPTETVIPELDGMEEAYENFTALHTLTDRTPREMFYNGYYAAIFSFIRAYEAERSNGLPV